MFLIKQMTERLYLIL